MAIITPTASQVGFRGQVLYTWANIAANPADSPAAIETKGAIAMSVSVQTLANIAIGTITMQGAWTDSATLTDWFTLTNPIGTAALSTFTGATIGFSMFTPIGTFPYWFRPWLTTAGTAGGSSTVRLLVRWPNS